MGTPENTTGHFEKVGECLYRYLSNGVYYARFESRGKEIRRSLGTTDRATAKRKLGDLLRDLAHVDLTAGKCSLAEMFVRHSMGRHVSRLESQAIGRLSRNFSAIV